MSPGVLDGFHCVPASVSKTCTVRFDNNKYSVLSSAVGRPVEIHAYADRIVIRQDGVVVGDHARAFGRGKVVYDPWHYVPVLARKPGGLRNGAPFREWVLPSAMEKVRRKLKMSDDGDRQMVSILTVLGTLEFVGSGALLSIDIPVAKTGNETEAIEVRVAEEYLPAGSTSPKSLWEDFGGEIDAVEWQWREVLLHVFWRAEDGSILYREQVGRRVIDSMRVEIDNQGRAVRILTLELPAITQRDIAAKTSNAQLQKLIDPTDKGFEHTARTAVQKFTLGKAQDQKVK